MRVEQTPIKDCFIVHEKLIGEKQGTLSKLLFKEILML